MSSFLDQSEIDKLQMELASLDEKKTRASSAKQKIRTMYYDILKNGCPNDLNTLDEIGIIINNINAEIIPSSKYYDSFNKLKYSYMDRV